MTGGNDVQQMIVDGNGDIYIFYGSHVSRLYDCALPPPTFPPPSHTPSNHTGAPKHPLTGVELGFIIAGSATVFGLLVGFGLWALYFRPNHNYEQLD